MKNLIFVLFICLPSLGFGQGLVLNDSVYNALPRQSLYQQGSKNSDADWDKTPIVNLRPYCPRPQSQGAIGSCTGWASGYSAFTILEAIKHSQKDSVEVITKNAFSALFIYNQIKIDDCEKGSYIHEAGEFLVSIGDIKSSAFDGIKNNCDRQPNTDELELASRFRIKDFMTLFASDATGNLKIEQTKKSLLHQRPVVIAMELRQNFLMLSASNATWEIDAGDTTYAGAHAMTVVGYDDTKEAFQLMNSWGTDWGDDGFCWVDYKTYAQFCRYGLQFIPYQSGKNLQLYEGEIEIQKLVFQDGNYQKEAVQPLFNGQNYTTGKHSLHTGDMIQVDIPKMTKGTYLYLFSCDADGKINVHWPRDGVLDQRFEGENESAYIMQTAINLTLPNKDAALLLEKKGKEHLCFLIAKRPIYDLNKKLKLLGEAPHYSFNYRIKKAFGTALKDSDSIFYSREKIQFKNTIGLDEILPIIVEIDVQ